MAFGESMSKIYVSIVDGMLAVRSSESDAKAVKRETKTGQVIFERKYKNLEGRIKEVGFRTNDYNGKKWEELFVLVHDGQDHYQLGMPFPGKYSLSFLRAVKNVDLKATISFNPWSKTVDGKVKAVLYMNIKGAAESVPWYYTKDTPNGLPDLVPYTVPGSDETKYSDVERNKFFRSMIETDIAPKLRAIWNDQPAATESFIPPPPDVNDLPDATDDLPF